MIDYETLSTQTGIALPPLLKEFLASGKTHYGPDWADTWRQRCLQDPPLFMSWQDFEWIDAEASREIIEGWLNPSAQNGRRFLPFAQSGAGDAWCLTPLDTHGVGVALVLHDDEASSVSHACFDDFVCAGFLQAFADLSDQLDEFSEPEALQLLRADVAQTTRFMTQELGGYLQDFCRRPLEIRPWRDGPRARVRQVASLISQDELAAELDRLPAVDLSFPVVARWEVCSSDEGSTQPGLVPEPAKIDWRTLAADPLQKMAAIRACQSEHGCSLGQAKAMVDQHLGGRVNAHA
ncbi:SMI1/KNR4 family protein [Delftia sp. WSY_4]|uniref:SMI1/KNR4 family protein n=1 Tax=Delftia TaxID=80865 RepID=UPI0035B56AB1